MKLKYYITFFLILLFFEGMAQNDTSSFKYRKPLFDFNDQKTVFKLKDEQLNNKNRFLRFYTVTGYREGVKPNIGAFGINFNSIIDTVSGVQLLTMYNLSIAEIVTHGLVRRNEIFLDVDDPSKYIYDPAYGDKINWMRKNAYCYELVLPLGTIKGIQTLDEYISNSFGVKFGMEKRLVKALILVRTSTIDKLKSAGKGEGKYDMKGYFNNVPIDRLNHPLAEAGLPPMVDETGYKDPVDMDLKIESWTDLSAIRKELHRYDLDLIDGMRELDMFVIKKK